MSNGRTIWTNGKIYSADGNFSVAAALVTEDGMIIYIGDGAGAKKYITGGEPVRDLGGAAVLPGLNDAHLHFLSLGESRTHIDAHWKPRHEILESVRAAAKGAGPGEWLIGRGWNQEIWTPPELPTRSDLDRVAPDIPAALMRTCGHMLWVNGRALDLTGIDRDTPDPAGGEYIRDEAGRPTGVMSDTAMRPVLEALSAAAAQDKKKALLEAQNELFRFGVTSAADAGSELSAIEEIQRLYEEKTLKIRLNVMACARDGSPGEMLREAREIFAGGIKTGLYGGRMQVRAYKLLADGSLGARGAWMLEDYGDRPGHRGKAIFTDGEMFDFVSAGVGAGFQMCVHAIGDAANRQALDTYERAFGGNARDLRCRIEHAQILTAADVPRFAELGVIPSMQTVHAESDRNMARERLGDRIEYAYAWRKLLNTGAVIPNGTDAPVEPVSPWRALHAAVTGGGLRPEERMTREEALWSYTAWPAYASFEEDVKGSLEPGKYADFVIIDRDYMTCPEDDIRDIRVLETVIAGETVYKADLSLEA